MPIVHAQRPEDLHAVLAAEVHLDPKGIMSVLLDQIRDEGSGVGRLIQKMSHLGVVREGESGGA